MDRRSVAEDAIGADPRLRGVARILGRVRRHAESTRSGGIGAGFCNGLDLTVSTPECPRCGWRMRRTAQPGEGRMPYRTAHG
jgi:hypothetical protein